jgi:hypothetical protein
VAAQDKQIGQTPAPAAPATAAPKAASPGKQPQAERGDGASSVHKAAVFGTSGQGAALPFHDQIQKAFGRHDVSHVKAYTDPGAIEGNREMGAEAFTAGSHIAFGRAPDLHLVAEEAAHVVQQRAGVKLPGGVGSPDDPHERQALAVADAVVAGKSAEPILDMLATSEAPASTATTDAKPGADAQVQMRAAGGGSSSRQDPFDALFGGRAHRAVNHAAAVQAEKGVRLRKSPGASSNKIIGHGTKVTILHETTEANEGDRWAYVTSSHGSGFVERYGVTDDIPECSARLYLIKPNDTLGGIAAKYFSSHFKTGNDARLYVQALYLSNKHRTGIKLTDASLSSWEKATHGKSEEETLKIYKGVEVIEDQSIWIPSNEFVQQLKNHGAISSGTSSIRKAWNSAKDAVEDIWDDVKYAAGLTAGLIHGCANAVYDLFKGAAELTGKVISIVAKLITGDLGGAIGVATGWVKELAKLWGNRGAIKDAFVAKWTDKDGWKRGNFQGETIGWILTSLALMFVSGGSSSTGMVAVLATKFPTMMKALQAASKLGDSLTWAKGAAKGAEKIGGKAKGEVKKVMGAAKKAADARKREKAAARKRKREREADKRRDEEREAADKKQDKREDKRQDKRWARLIERGEKFRHIDVEKVGTYTDGLMLVRATGNFAKSIVKHASEQTQGVALQPKDSNACGMYKVELLPSGVAALRKAVKGKRGPIAKQIIAFLHGKQESVAVQGAAFGSSGRMEIDLTHRATEKPFG